MAVLPTNLYIIIRVGWVFILVRIKIVRDFIGFKEYFMLICVFQKLLFTCRLTICHCHIIFHLVPWVLTVTIAEWKELCRLLTQNKIISLLTPAVFKLHYSHSHECECVKEYI